MRRRRLLLGLGAVTLLGAAGLLVVLLQPRTGVMVESYGRIQDGMTLAEVEAVLGRPAQDYRSQVSELFLLCEAMCKHGLQRTTLVWIEDELAVLVAFEQDKVCYKIKQIPSRPSTNLQRLRRLLPW